MLVQSNSDAPLAYGIYVFMQSPAGRGAGAALGVIAVVIVAVCTVLSQFVIERGQRTRKRAMTRHDDHDPASRDIAVPTVGVEHRRRQPVLRRSTTC